MSTYNNLIKNIQSKIGPEIVSFALTAAQKGDLEAVTYICEYLETRKRKRHLNSLLRELNKTGFSPIPFLSEARKISETFQKNTKGSNHVYVILLNHETKGFGLYVGQTSRKIETRFQQHLSGNRKENFSARCHSQMQMLLPTLFEHLNPLSTNEAKHIEKSLIYLFKQYGIRTEGG